MMASGLRQASGGSNGSLRRQSRQRPPVAPPAANAYASGITDMPWQLP